MTGAAPLRQPPVCTGFSRGHNPHARRWQSKTASAFPFEYPVSFPTFLSIRFHGVQPACRNRCYTIHVTSGPRMCLKDAALADSGGFCVFLLL